MAQPVVAIVGRPNVGKSTLFNKLIGQRLSIVDDTPGVTRDRIFGNAEWLGKNFMLIDTGGIEPKTDDIILKKMRAQAELAIDTASVIIFVTDLKSGVTAADMEVAAMLQKSGKPIVLCVNKCDAIGEILGHAIYSFKYPAHLHIDILPDYQSKGIGSKLIKAFCDNLREQNVKGVMLIVGTENEGARRFYERNGFTLLQDMPTGAAYGMKF